MEKQLNMYKHHEIMKLKNPAIAVQPSTKTLPCRRETLKTGSNVSVNTSSTHPTPRVLVGAFLHTYPAKFDSLVIFTPTLSLHFMQWDIHQQRQ